MGPIWSNSQQIKQFQYWPVHLVDVLCPRCTHLLCAFTNTPKFQQVAGVGGRVVKRDWVEESHRARKRLPWRRFCLAKGDRGEESEEEVWEEGVEGGADEETEETGGHGEVEAEAGVAPYDMDTDEEIEQIKQKEAEESGRTVKKGAYEVETDEELEPEPTKVKNDGDDSAYDADTDIDEEVLDEMRPKTKHLDFEPLPNFFASQEFYLHGDYEAGEAELIERYIVASGGRVQPYMQKTVDKVVSASNWWSDDFSCALEVVPGVSFLRPSWVFACTDQGRLVEEGTHRIIK